MKAHTPLLTALLLGGLVVTAPARANDPAQVVDPAAGAVEPAAPAEPAAVDADLVSEVADVAAGAEQPSVAEADADADAYSGEEQSEVQPAWIGRVLVSAESQVGPDGQPVSDRTLRLVQRSSTGMKVAGKVALSLLAGTIGGSGFSKHELHGTRIDTVPNPAFNYLKEKMRASMTTYFAAHPGAIPAEETSVQATVAEFTLIYKELGNAQTEYELRQTMHVGFPYRRKLLRLTGGEGAQCSIAEPVSAPLEAWQADDYAMAKQVAQRYTDDCAAKFAASLPTLFPDRDPVAAEPETTAVVENQGV